MDILVTYDVSTETNEGRSRLRKVAKICEGYGQRVQFSVFECTLGETDFTRMRIRLLRVIAPQEDSLRIYRLRGRREESVEAFGIDKYINFRDSLVV